MSSNYLHEVKATLNQAFDECVFAQHPAESRVITMNCTFGNLDPNDLQTQAHAELMYAVDN